MSKNRSGTASLTAGQTVGWCESVPRREAREALLEKKVFDFFAGTGQPVWRQVYCGFAGVADIVTEDAIYELKDRLLRRTYQQALGQLQLYKNYLNPLARTGIICNCTDMSLRKLAKLENLTGVSVLVWNPPYPRPPATTKHAPR